jgi:hypothetical protein
VSYAYEFTKRALAQFQQLDPWLGEELLDELEGLVTCRPAHSFRTPNGFVHDFVHEHATGLCHVFLTILPDVRREVLRVTSVGIYVRGK